MSDIKKINDDEYKLNVEYKEYEIAKQFFDDNIVEFAVASENKSNKEIDVADYFDNTVLNAAEYLNGMDSETFSKTVDSNGLEKKQDTKNINNSNMGIS